MNCSTFADRWNICAENLLWLVVEIQAEILLSLAPVHMLSLQQANISTELFESKTGDFYQTVSR